MIKMYVRYFSSSMIHNAAFYGPGGASVRPRRRVATRVSIVSGIEKKGDLGYAHGLARFTVLLLTCFRAALPCGGIFTYLLRAAL